MKKRISRICLVMLIMMLSVLSAGCRHGKEVSEEKPVQSESEAFKASEAIFDSHMQTDDTTESVTQTGNSKEDETKAQESSGPKPQKPVQTFRPESSKHETVTPANTEHKHRWVEQSEMVYHEAEGHYETVIVKEAWDEAIYEKKIVCGCGEVFEKLDEWGQHTVDGCIYGYTVAPVQVGTKHHDAVTEERYVQDREGWTEKIVSGYRCSICGRQK